MGDDNDKHVPSWLEEFEDELVGLPTHEEVEFYLVGDLAFLEKLLEGEPAMEIKQIPNEEKEKVVEEFDSRPVEKLEDGLPPRSRTWERARWSLDQHLLRIRG
ncbi:hypothetical protein Hanom_Chr03g00207291 [Helianthus anomalus]